MHVVFVITLIVYILKSKKTKPKKKIGKWYSHTSQACLNLWYNCVQEQKNYDKRFR